MLDPVSVKLNADELIKSALKEDIPNEDVSTNAVLKDIKRVKPTLSANRTV